MVYKSNRPNRGIADKEVLSRLEPNSRSDYESALKKFMSAYCKAEERGLDISKIRKKHDFLVRKMKEYLGAEVADILVKKYPLDGGLEKE